VLATPPLSSLATLLTLTLTLTLILTVYILIIGLECSSDGTTLLASYQSDQIYTFPVNNFGIDRISSFVSESSEVSDIMMDTLDDFADRPSGAHSQNYNDNLLTMTTKKCIGAKQCFGGHINYATFLKQVRLSLSFSLHVVSMIITSISSAFLCFFEPRAHHPVTVSPSFTISYQILLSSSKVAFLGPRDEYIVSGSDSGHIWVWDAKTSGHLPINFGNRANRVSRVINYIQADTRTVNGVIPHPSLPLFAR
jgi:hypothetical protein